MLEDMVLDAPDHALNKINALDLAAKEGLDEERVIAALLNAVRLGIFEMSWNVMCRNLLFSFLSRLHLSTRTATIQMATTAKGSKVIID